MSNNGVRRTIAVLCGISALLLVGCASTYKADPALVAKYQAPPAPAADETHVYFIRGSNFQGGARGLWVAVNDKVVADVANGSHVLLKLKSGLNSIHGVQGKAGFGYVAVDNRPAQTAFVVVDYTTGTTKEVEKDLGISMVMQTTAAQPLAEPRPNDAYDNLVTNPAVLGLDLIAQGGEALQPDATSAVVTFYRPGQLIANVPFSIWSDKGYVGSLTGDTFMQVRVPAGANTFVTLSEHYQVVRADLEAGKHYAIQQSVGMGWNQAHVQLLPMNANDAKAKAEIAGWDRKLKRTSTNAAALAKPEVAERLKLGEEFLKANSAKWLAAEAASRELKRADGR